MLPITIGSTIRTSIRIRKVDWFIYTREPTSDLDIETGVQRADDISAAETPTEQQAIAEEEEPAEVDSQEDESEDNNSENGDNDSGDDGNGDGTDG